MDKILGQRESFEKRAGRYYRKRETGNHGYLKKLMWREFFRNKDFLTGRKNMLILEPMCGYGDGYDMLRRNIRGRFSYRGFDYSETLVEIARRNHPGLDISVMDVTQFEEEDKYDLILIIGSLHHVPDCCLDVVKSMHRALKKGGYFINFEPTQNNWLFRKIRQMIYKKNKTFDSDTERAFDLPELNAYYAGAGFKVLDQLHMGLSAFVLYYNPNAFPMLNIGGRKLVKFFFQVDRMLFRSTAGRKLSFATGSLLVKQ